MSKFGVLYKNYYKLTGRPIFNTCCRSSDINQSSRRLTANTSCIRNINERDERENEVANILHLDQELEILKRQNLEDFVKIVDKFQKAKLADLQKVLILAQRLQVNHQRLKDENLVLKIDDLNKINLTRVDQMTTTTAHPNLAAIPKIEEVGTDVDENTSCLETSVVEKPQLSTITTFTKQESRKVALPSKFSNQKYMEEMQVNEKLKMKEAIMLNDIKSYLDLCITNGLLNRAYTFLTNCYLRGKTKQTGATKAVRNIELYVDLMDAWAKKGSYEAIKKLYLQIVDMKLKPNYRVFAAIFECLGRGERINTNVVKYYIAEAQKNGLNMEELFSERIYRSVEKMFVLKSLSPMLPNLSFKPINLVHEYDCSLVNHLNESSVSSNPLSDFLSKEDVDSRLHRMLEMEMLDQVKVKSIVPESALNYTIQVARAQLNKHREEWRRALLENFNSTVGILEKCSTQMNSGTSLYPFMKLWNPEVYVDFMMQEIEVMGQYLMIYCPPTHHLQYVLGQKVFNRFSVQAKAKKLRQLLPTYREYLEKLLDKDLSIPPRKLWNEIALANSYHLVLPETWSYDRKREIGKLLYDIIMTSVKVRKPTKDGTDVKDSSEWNIAAFYTKHVTKDHRPQEEVMAHPLMRKLYREAELPEMVFSPTELPMLLPPLPWTMHNNGGCLLNTVTLIKNDSLCKDQVELIKSLPNQKLFPVFDGLNVLSNCPWRVNTWVLDIIIKIFLEGGNKHLDIPKKHSGMSKVKICLSMSDEERKAARKHNDEVMKQDMEHYSIWMAELYRLSIANQFRNEPFWLAHSVDFRGRAYPSQPHFNHFGSDVARSLLEFGVGKPLGPKGLDWLKIHLINLTGFMKKKSNEEKLAYANESIHEIEDSADRPMDGNKWWQTSDKPWETLSCCKEIVDALRSPDPEKFISHLPIHQDGSCNGLQHYAALGRDTKGAKSVSLAPSPVPQDVYSDVVDIIEKERIKDAESGNEIAKALEGFVRRKVVKQTIMTTVYGVTQFGAMKQIEGQLKDIEEFPSEFLKEGRNYLTKKTFESLEALFTSAKQIQNWFVQTSSLISERKKQKVSWYTPLGWPVLQPYVKEKRLNNGKILLLPCTMKQKNAFAPNFIHSLDSTHMLLTAIHCHQAGVMFASIHDCFWTHAADVPQMNKICREQFVALHKEPILEDLSKHFVRHYGVRDSDVPNAEGGKEKTAEAASDHKFRQIPKKGDFNIEEVKDSTYFFS